MVGEVFLSLCKPLCNFVTAGLRVICYQNQVEKNDQAEEPSIQLYKLQEWR